MNGVADRIGQRLNGKIKCVQHGIARYADRAIPEAGASQVSRLLGRLVTADERTLVATFDGPGRAVGCASLLITLVADCGGQATAGVAVGACDPTRAEGPVYAASLALAESAMPGAVHASRMVVDLVPGSGWLFEPVTLSDSVVWRVIR